MARGSRKLILIAIGNPLRGDDGVAQRVLQLLETEADTRVVLQLAPEIAEDVAGYETVVFLDADAQADTVAIEHLGHAFSGGNSPLTHAANAAEIVALSAALYGFTGRALLCHIPASDFSPGEGLSAAAELAASRAAAMLRRRAGGASGDRGREHA